MIPDNQIKSIPAKCEIAHVSTDADFLEAQLAANLCRDWHRLKAEENLSGNQAAAALGKSPSWFSVNFPRWQRGGVAAFLPERRELGAARRLFTDLPPWFLSVARFFYLNTNLTTSRGSIPESIRRAIHLPTCPPAIQKRLIKVCLNHGWKPVPGEKLPTFPGDQKETILDREKSGKPMLPESITKQISIAVPFVKQHRNPTDAGLEYISAAGTQMWIGTGEGSGKIFIRSGDVVECDDATINFPVCIPWTIRGCPCSERYEVKVGRFQWLVAIDAGSRRVLGFCYTGRPRSSYRGEDVLALMRCVARQHGIPRVWRLEKGVWKSNLVENAVKAMGSGRMSVHSPHAKPFIEGLFNKLWTKLSVWFPEASVGRFRGENEESNRLLTSCHAGHQDPRKYFPMLADVIAAFHAVIDEHNASTVRSDNYGQWVPIERWENDIAKKRLPEFEPETDWIFSPFVRSWTVRGANVGGKVPLMDGGKGGKCLSVPYIFSASFLLNFHGARVRAHFDPGEPRCFATIVLEHAFGNHRAGEVLGVAPQINETTAYIRLVMGYGDDSPHSGIDARRQAASALRREVRGINGPSIGKADLPGHRQNYSESEERDGLGSLQRFSTVAPFRNDENPAVQTADFPRQSILAKADDLESFETDNPHLFL